MTDQAPNFDRTRSIPEQIGEWIDEAALTLAVLPSKGLRPAGAGSTWPDYVRDPDDLDWARESDDLLPRPTAAQIARLDIVLTWIPLIDDQCQRAVVHMRMIRHPMSGNYKWPWRKIGKRLKVSPNTAISRFEEACAAIGKKIEKTNFPLDNLINLPVL